MELVDYLYGSALYDEDEKKYKQYGLYEPITNSFVITHSKLHYITYLQHLFSSRFSLVVIDITTSINFDEKLIDNTCVDNWMLKKTDVRTLNPGQMGWTQVINATQLHKKIDKVDNSLLKDTLPYIIYALKIIHAFDDAISLMFGKHSGNINMFPDYRLYDYNFFDIYVKQPFDYSSYSQQTLEGLTYSRKEIFNIIYTEFNYEVAKEKMKPYLNEMVTELM